MDARAWDERYAASELVWSATPNQFVAAELSDLPPGRALDLAAGEGRNALWLADRGWHVTAVDFSRVALDKGRALQARHEHGADLRVEWVCADALTYEPGPTRFDLAVLAYLQLTADERRESVLRAFLAVRPGGTFFLVAHDSSNLSEGTGGPTDPSVLFTAEEVLADLDGERFEVVRAGRVAREVRDEKVAGSRHNHHGDQTRTAYDALVRLVRE
jgi:SAM-dependent methyltransferase